jgi:hypothetical protein
MATGAVMNELDVQGDTSEKVVDWIQLAQGREFN